MPFCNHIGSDDLYPYEWGGMRDDEWDTFENCQQAGMKAVNDPDDLPTGGLDTPRHQNTAPMKCSLLYIRIEPQHYFRGMGFGFDAKDSVFPTDCTVVH